MGNVSLIDGHIDGDTPGMTDNEIIKALECCTTETCWDCPFEPKEQRKGTFGCCEENIKNALELINRQKAEIERLKEFEYMYNDLCK